MHTLNHILLAATGIDDWIQIVVVVLVVVGSAVAKIAQTLIAHFNERQAERRRDAGPAAMRPRAAESDRPVARPMPTSAPPRRTVAPFGQTPRREPTGVGIPPVARTRERLDEALGEVLSRLGVPQPEKMTAPPPPRPASASPRPTGAGDPPKRRVVIRRTTRAPIHGAPERGAPARSARTPAAQTPSKPEPGAATPDRATTWAPSQAEAHLGHLRSDVESRDAVTTHAVDHIGHLHSVLGGALPASGRAGGIRDILGLQDRRSLRRAIVLAEVLGRPVALRDPP